MDAPPEWRRRLGKDSKMEQRDNNKNKKIIGYAVAVIAVIAAVIIGIVASKGNDGTKLQKLLDAGEKYLAELDYEQAVAVYNEVIALDPKNVEAYLGLAEAYVGMGDTEAAIAALKAGYEATGDGTIADRLAQLEEEEYTPAPSGQEMETEESTGQLTLQYDFRPEDITLMGYNLFADHYQEIFDAMAASREWSGSNGKYSLETEDRSYSCSDNGENLRYEVKILSHPEPNTTYTETLWDVIYENNDLYGQSADGRHIWTLHGYGEGFDDVVSAPIRNHQSFEEVCELLQVETIREKAQGSDNNTAEQGWYDFKSNLGDCHYYESFYESNSEDEDSIVGTCAFDIYYENGYTFKIMFSVLKNGLVDGCIYEYYLDAENEEIDETKYNLEYLMTVEGQRVAVYIDKNAYSNWEFEPYIGYDTEYEEYEALELPTDIYIYDKNGNEYFCSPFEMDTVEGYADLWRQLHFNCKIGSQEEFQLAGRTIYKYDYVWADTGASRFSMAVIEIAPGVGFKINDPNGEYNKSSLEEVLEALIFVVE